MDRPGGGPIEHTRKREVIKTADWIIDLGPEGGEIVAEGTPEDVAKEPRSYTGSYLKPLLSGIRADLTPAKKRKRSSIATEPEQEDAE